MFSGGSGGGQVTRGGLDLSSGGRNEINSFYDLVGVQVEAEVDGTRAVLDSPWPADNSLQQTLPDLLDRLSVTADPFIEGRININQARRETLLGIPGMTEALADAIVNSNFVGSSGEPLPDTVSTRATTAWLISEGLVTIEEMRKLDRFLTTRGDVYRVQSIGYYDAGGPVARLEAVIDATQQPPRIIFQRDLTDLGRGYSPQLLTPSQSAEF